MNIRNVAIIAHVDHGKTTLVDALLRQSNTKMGKDVAGELIMDSNDLERERGITIFSKNAAVVWGDTKINIIDTPGHADFGGEVERVLSMADGCLLLVDAKEGPMPQTRFVLKQALKMGHRVVVVINKIDKPDARPAYALDKTFDLFVELGADDHTLDFPVIYAAAKQGVAGKDANLAAMQDITPVFDAILEYIPVPKVDASKPLQMLVTNVVADSFKGRIAIGRVYNGAIAAKSEVMRIRHDGTMTKGRITSLMTFSGLDRPETELVEAGDIAAVAGFPDVTIGETLADVLTPVALVGMSIEEPTVKMTISVNDSPFAGQEGRYSTGRQIRERLDKELENDLALKVEDSPEGGWVVSGRGELHLAILIERMRRDGYEFQVSRPQVITKMVEGQRLDPFDRVFIEVPEGSEGVIMSKLGARHGELREMQMDNGIVSLEFVLPTRGLFGYRSEFLTDTRGLGIINTSFYGYQKDAAPWRDREQGSLVAHETGTTNLYGLLNIQDRGLLFIGPAVGVYKGQVVGQHSRSGDLSVNVCKAKELSNMRSKGDGSAEHFNAPKTMGLEDALEYIGDDELVEVTPQNVRIRKRTLDERDAKRKAMGLA